MRMRENACRIAVRPCRVPEAMEPYYTVGNALVPFLDNIETARSRPLATGSMALMRTQQPHERDLQDLPELTAHAAPSEEDLRCVACCGKAPRERLGLAPGG